MISNGIFNLKNLKPFTKPRIHSFLIEIGLNAPGLSGRVPVPSGTHVANQALRHLGQHLGMFKDHVELKIDVHFGGHGMITAKDVLCLVSLARVYGLPALRRDRGNTRDVQAIIDKWDRLNGGLQNPPSIEDCAPIEPEDTKEEG